MDGRLRQDDLRFIVDDLTDERILALLKLHLNEMHANSPACKVHALPPHKLREPGVIFWSAWHGDKLAGCGALKEIDARHGELKSMRAAPEYRGRGVGEAMLLHLFAEARRRGYSRLSLETGRPAFFRPAQALYEKHGFAECADFCDYTADEFSMCMSRTL